MHFYSLAISNEHSPYHSIHCDLPASEFVHPALPIERDCNSRSINAREQRDGGGERNRDLHVASRIYHTAPRARPGSTSSTEHNNRQESAPAQLECLARRAGLYNTVRLLRVCVCVYPWILQCNEIN